MKEPTIYWIILVIAVTIAIYSLFQINLNNEEIECRGEVVSCYLVFKTINGEISSVPYNICMPEALDLEIMMGRIFNEINIRKIEDPELKFKEVRCEWITKKKKN